MGGRGASSAISGSNKVTSLVGRDGNIIDLSESPLQYGKQAQSLTAGEKLKVLPFEKEHLNANVEHALLVDKAGNVVYTNTGTDGGVRISKSALEKADVLTHNHPRSGRDNLDVLGGTFSNGDLKAFVGNNISTMRAAAHEGTYIITKGKNFDGRGLNNYINKAEGKYFSAYWQKARNLKTKEQDKEFNKYLVTMHNEFIKNQKKYGYTYSLEKRRD